MKAKEYDAVRLTVAKKSTTEEWDLPVGTLGTIVECYTQPHEGYDVDIALPDPQSVTGFKYDFVTLLPEEFEVVENA